MYINEPISKYVNDLAARQPTPGGGSAAALCGAVGTALLEMVCNFTIGNEKYKNMENDVKAYLGSLKNIHDEFASLIDEDVYAYSAIRAAFKSKDKKNIDKALKDGYYISLRVCELSKNALDTALKLSDKGNINLITDVGCGAELLNAAFNSGVFNADINIKGIDDKVFAEKEKKVIAALKKEIGISCKTTIAKTKERMI